MEPESISERVEEMAFETIGGAPMTSISDVNLMQWLDRTPVTIGHDLSAPMSHAELHPGGQFGIPILGGASGGTSQRVSTNGLAVNQPTMQTNQPVTPLRPHVSHSPMGLPSPFPVLGVADLLFDYQFQDADYPEDFQHDGGGVPGPADLRHSDPAIGSGFATHCTRPLGSVAYTTRPRRGGDVAVPLPAKPSWIIFGTREGKQRAGTGAWRGGGESDGVPSTSPEEMTYGTPSPSTGVGATECSSDARYRARQTTSAQGAETNTAHTTSSSESPAHSSTTGSTSDSDSSAPEVPTQARARRGDDDADWSPRLSNKKAKSEVIDANEVSSSASRSRSRSASRIRRKRGKNSPVAVPVPPYGIGIISRLKVKMTNLAGAEDIKVCAIVLGLSPQNVRKRLLGFIEPLDDDGFVTFVQLLSERALAKSKNVPNRGVFKAAGGIKTRADAEHIARSLRDKLKGKTPFQIMSKDGGWVTIKTKDPPWRSCIMLEFKRILDEFDPTKTKTKARASALQDSWNVLEAFFNDDFYAEFITLLEETFPQSAPGGAAKFSTEAMEADDGTARYETSGAGASAALDVKMDHADESSMPRSRVAALPANCAGTTDPMELEENEAQAPHGSPLAGSDHARVPSWGPLAPSPEAVVHTAHHASAGEAAADFQHKVGIGNATSSAMYAAQLAACSSDDNRSDCSDDSARTIILSRELVAPNLNSNMSPIDCNAVHLASARPPGQASQLAQIPLPSLQAPVNANAEVQTEFFVDASVRYEAEIQRLREANQALMAENRALQSGQPWHSQGRSDLHAANRLPTPHPPLVDGSQAIQLRDQLQALHSQLAVVTAERDQLSTRLALQLEDPLSELPISDDDIEEMFLLKSLPPPDPGLASTAVLPPAPTPSVPPRLPSRATTADVKDRIHEFEKQVAALQSHVARLVDERDRLGQELARVGDDRRAVLAELRRLQGELSAAAAARQTVANTLQQMDRQLSNLTDSTASAKQDYLRELHGLRQTQTTLATATTAAENRIGELTALLQKSQRETAQAREALAKHARSRAVDPNQTSDGGSNNLGRFDSGGDAPSVVLSRSECPQAPDAALLAACGRGDQNAAASAMNDGASIEASSAGGRSPLEIAVNGKHSELALWLVAVHAANPRSVSMSRNEMGVGSGCETPAATQNHMAATQQANIITSIQVIDGPFHRRCAMGDIAWVTAAIKSRPEVVESPNAFGATPLHAACVAGQVGVARLLVQSGAVVDAEKRAATVGGASPRQAILVCLDSSTALVFAVMMRRLDVVRFLVEAGANVNRACRIGGATPLSTACFHGYSDVVQCLVGEARADVNRAIGDGSTPLHVASGNGHIGIVRYLTRIAGADVNRTNADGVSPIYIASWSGHLDVVRFLSETAATDVNKAQTSGYTALHAATANGHLDIVRYLASEAKANVAQVDNSGWTPLYIACFAGHVEVLRYLVHEIGCSASQVDNAGFSPLHIASRSGHLGAVQYLTQDAAADVNVKDNTGSTPLHMAVLHNQASVVRHLVEEAEAEVNLADRAGFTPLHTASSSSNIDMVRYLVSKGKAAVDLHDANGVAPLHTATEHGHLAIVQCLAGVAGANVDSKTNLGRSALFVASCNGHLDIVRYLVAEAGAGVDIETPDGVTPLHGASMNGHANVVRYLARDAHADLDKAADSGMTPVRAACENEHRDIARALLFVHGADQSKSGLGPKLHKSLKTEHDLVVDGEVPRNCVKLFLSGPTGAGKTTLASALSRNLVQNIWYDSTAPESTLGFSVSRRDIPNAGVFSVWDLGGHPGYYPAHELCMQSSESIFVVVCSLRESPANQLKEAVRWLNMIISSAPRGSRVVLVGSNRDRPHPKSEPVMDPVSKQWVAASGKTILTEVTRRYGNRVAVWPRFFCLDSRKARSSEKDGLRSALQQMRTNVLAGSNQIPRMCRKLVTRLAKLRISQRVMKVSAITADMREQAKCPGLSESETVMMLQYLHDSGDVLFFSTDPKLREAVILDPHWFGTILMRRICLPPTASHADIPSSVLSRNEMVKLTSADGDGNGDATDIDAILDILLQLELCYTVADGNSYTFPGLCHPNNHATAQLVAGYDSMAWVSRRLRRADTEKALPARFFGKLQVRLGQKYGKSCFLWTRGIIMSRGTTRGYLELSADNRVLDVVVVGPPNVQKLAARIKLLADLIAVATAVHAEICGPENPSIFALGDTSTGELVTPINSDFSIDSLKALTTSSPSALSVVAQGPTGTEGDVSGFDFEAKKEVSVQ